MSMYLEVWSKDWNVFGDGVSMEAKVNLSGYPINLDLSELPVTLVDVYAVNDPGPPPVLEKINSKFVGTFVTITFRAPIASGASRVMRLRARCDI
jgi:hypothetical protein